MMKELVEGSYMEALLRAAVLLGDLHRTVPVREITISGFLVQNRVRRLCSRCKIVSAEQSDQSGEAYLILYPI